MSINAGGGGGSSTLARNTDVLVSSPADGQLLQYNGSANKWENVLLDRAQITMATNQSITSSASTLYQVVFGTKQFDTNGLFSAGSSNQLTIKTAGMYRVDMEMLWWGSSTAGRRAINLYVNGTAQGFRLSGGAVNAADGPCIAGTREMGLNANDVLTCWAQQDTGAALTLGAAFLTVTRIP